MTCELSFCIITAGRRALDGVLRAIFAQAARAEVVVAGRPPARDDIVGVPLPGAADAGQLGALRNAAVQRARGEWLAILDDDIVLQAGYLAAFAQRRARTPIVTARVLLPDGTRYWDHATCGGPRGHVLLPADAPDPHLYMTGGGGWAMHRSVAATVAWDAARGFYAQEDTDFAARCRGAGFAIAHEPRMVVLHAAPEYTSFGNRVLRRTAVASPAWVLALRGERPDGLLARAALCEQRGLLAEAADVLRAAALWHPEHAAVARARTRLEQQCGGALDGSRWRPADACAPAGLPAWATA